MAEGGVTRTLARWVATAPRGAITPRALRCARHAVLDWTGVCLAGAGEPLVAALIDDAVANGECGSSPLMGRKERLSPAFAALVNGAASHALDFDDVNARVHGHPTVAILPAILSAAIAREATGADVLDALVIGTEVACAVGLMLGPAHYAQGFHATATVGCVGAAAGVARLLALDEERAACALALGATQAAGLKVNFGTMAKPLHAGRAAMSGLLAARWAAAGLTASTQAIEAEHGFGMAMSPAFLPTFTAPDGAFGVESNCYKFYPACYYTHSAIAAVGALRAEHSLTPESIASVFIRLQPQHDKVCNIAAPRDGLGIKFSVRHLVAMTLSGVDVGNPVVFTAGMAERPDLVALRERVVFEASALPTRTAADIAVTLADGRVFKRAEDVGVPAADLDRQEERLLAKFLGLAAPVLGGGPSQALSRLILSFDGTDRAEALFAAGKPEGKGA